MKKLQNENQASITQEDLKQKIRDYLDKLNDSSTRDLYFKNFKIFLQSYTEETTINITFNLLLSYTNDAMTLIGKEYQIILIAFALNINYIKNMTYTILNKILKNISDNLEKYNNLEIQKACSVVCIEIFDQILKMGENQETAFSFLIKFFLDLIDKKKAVVSQYKDNGIINGSFVIISDILSYIISLNSSNKIELKNNNEENNEINMKNGGIEQINRKIERDEIEKASTLNSLQKILEETLFNLINKFILFKYPNPFLIEAITYLIDVVTYEDYKAKIKEIIPHLNKILYNTEAKLYLTKIMICHFYSHLYQKKIQSKNIDEEIIQDIIKALNFATKDRVAKVQIAAEDTLSLYNNIDNKEIHNKRKLSKLNLLRNLSKINKERNNIMSSKKVRKEIYNIGIGKFLRSNDYLNNRDEENILKIKKEINKSRSKSKKEKRKIKLTKNKKDIGIMIFQRFDGFNEDNKSDEMLNENNIRVKSSKNNYFFKNLKDDDINLNDDLENIKKSLTKKEKYQKENNNNEDDIDNKDNNNINNNDINNNIKTENSINEDDKKNDNIKEKEKEKEKELFMFKEEKSNIGDNQAPLISENNLSNKNRNKRNNSKDISNENELNISENNDSSNLQGNTIEDLTKLKRNSQNIKNISINNRYNTAFNDVFSKISKNFNEEMDKMMNKFNNNINNKLNNLNNRLLGLSQNVNRIKSNLSLIKHTNNLKFKDSNVIIKEEKEEVSLESSTVKYDNKYNINSSNILWETINIYLKNENFEEAYIKSLQFKDDIIFLKLIFSLGTKCLPFISVDTNKMILKHFNSIFRTFSLQNKFLEFIYSFYNMKMMNIKYFTKEELNDFMQTLFEIKKLENDVGKKAQILYDKILKDFLIQSNNK
jgi:hypothetical protein